MKLFVFVVIFLAYVTSVYDSYSTGFVVLSASLHRLSPGYAAIMFIASAAVLSAYWQLLKRKGLCVPVAQEKISDLSLITISGAGKTLHNLIW